MGVREDSFMEEERNFCLSRKLIVACRDYRDYRKQSQSYEDFVSREGGIANYDYRMVKYAGCPMRFYYRRAEERIRLASRKEESCSCGKAVP
jgi:hypothetical protein